MRRRTLLILALSLLLVVPAVMAVASSGSDFDSGSMTVDQVREQAQDRDCAECGYDSVVAERDQIRGRDQDRTNAPDVDREEIQEQKQLRIHDPASDVDGERIQEQKQLRIHDPASDVDGEQVQTREREQVRDQANCDGDGLQLREQVRTEAQQQLKLAEPQGEQQGYGPGSESGNGPLHEGPEDGTGNQFGRGGR